MTLSLILFFLKGFEAALSIAGIGLIFTYITSYDVSDCLAFDFYKKEVSIENLINPFPNKRIILAEDILCIEIRAGWRGVTFVYLSVRDEKIKIAIYSARKIDISELKQDFKNLGVQIIL